MKLGRLPSTVSAVAALVFATGASSQPTAERVCPDGGRSFFGVCPNDKPAANQLQRQLEQLANFPKDVALKPPGDQFESLVVPTTPRALYETLSTYDKASIQSVPEVGNDLFEFRKAYYVHRQSEIEFEEYITQKISDLAKTHSTEGWKTYLNYYILRSFGHSPDNIQKSGEVFTFGFSWPEAEEIEQTLLKDNVADQRLKGQKAQYEALLRMAEGILRKYR